MSLWDLGSNIISNIGNQVIAKNQRDWQKEENNLMREREDNAIQRRMADLNKANMNPLLAGNIGGASATAGTVTQAMPIQSTNVGNIIADIKEQSARTKNTETQTRLTNEQVETEIEKTNLTKEQQRLAKKQCKEINSKIDLLGSQKNLADASKAWQELETQYWKAKEISPNSNQYTKILAELGSDGAKQIFNGIKSIVSELFSGNREIPEEVMEWSQSQYEELESYGKELEEYLQSEEVQESKITQTMKKIGEAIQRWDEFVNTNLWDKTPFGR